MKLIYCIEKKIPKMALFLLLSLLLFTTCKKEKVPEPYRPTDAHDAYGHSLEQAGLANTALGQDWLERAERVLKEPLKISPPYREIFYVGQTDVFAFAYQFSVKRGQLIEAIIQLESEKPTRIFIDLFRFGGQSETPLIQVASADEDEQRLEFEPRRDAEYILRIQHELLRGGRYNITIQRKASLQFPVSGKNSRSIQSGFGAPRDGGRRTHHGVDIFAPRHTPVIAPSRAFVRYVGEGGLGGRKIWLYDPKIIGNLYFAHLQKANVVKDAWVEPGEIIGTVGNTGNARSTAPHLHFGIYLSGVGPVNPYHYITQTDKAPAQVSADPTSLGRWIRPRTNTVNVYSAWPRSSREITRCLPHTAMWVSAVAGQMYRVRFPDGKQGYVRARDTEFIHSEISSHISDLSLDFHSHPSKKALIMGYLSPGEEFSILGRFKDFWLIKTVTHPSAWLQMTTELGGAKLAPGN